MTSKEALVHDRLFCRLWRFSRRSAYLPVERSSRNRLLAWRIWSCSGKYSLRRVDHPFCGSTCAIQSSFPTRTKWAGGCYSGFIHSSNHNGDYSGALGNQPMGDGSTGSLAGCSNVDRWHNHPLTGAHAGTYPFVEYEIGNCDLFPGRHRKPALPGIHRSIISRSMGCTDRDI